MGEIQVMTGIDHTIPRSRVRERGAVAHPSRPHRCLSPAGTVLA